jgi:hypothetical protein
MRITYLSQRECSVEALIEASPTRSDPELQLEWLDPGALAERLKEIRNRGVAGEDLVDERKQLANHVARLIVDLRLSTSRWRGIPLHGIGHIVSVDIEVAAVFVFRGWVFAWAWSYGSSLDTTTSSRHAWNGEGLDEVAWTEMEGMVDASKMIESSSGTVNRNGTHRPLISFASKQRPH